MTVADLVHEMHVRLLAGFAADTVTHAAVIAEASLKALAGKPPDAKAMFGELVGELHKQLEPTMRADLNWLNAQRIAAVHYTGKVRPDLDADARRAVDTVEKLVVAAGLLDVLALASLRQRAEWTASEPASTSLLRLDRAPQRKGLDDLLAVSKRVLVLLVHGEFGQGHDHFGELTTWRLRAGPKGRWREIEVAWPSPSPSLGTRIAMLVESLANAVGVQLTGPSVDPTSGEGEAAWARALEPVLDTIDQLRERLVVRHTLRWLGDGKSGDDEVVERYIRSVWWRVAERKGERLVVAFDVRRLEPAGIPLSKSWRTARNEAKVSQAIAHRLEELELPRDGMCATLAELASVTAPDLADWLRAEAGRRRSDADAEAAQLHATTRGGRFELVVERLAALNLDRKTPR